VDRDALIDRLSEAHAVALRLSDAGQGDEVIAAALGVPPASVPQLLSVDEAKLAHLPPERERSA
jgi:hypothetical protein